MFPPLPAIINSSVGMGSWEPIVIHAGTLSGLFSYRQPPLMWVCHVWKVLCHGAIGSLNPWPLEFLCALLLDGPYFWWVRERCDRPAPFRVEYPRHLFKKLLEMQNWLQVFTHMSDQWRWFQPVVWEIVVSLVKSANSSNLCGKPWRLKFTGI